MFDTPLLTHIQRVRDDRFDIDKIEKYSLNLLLGSSIRVAIADNEQHRFIWLDDYTPNPDLPIIAQLTYLYEQHEILSAGFWGSVRISIDNACFSLVPKSLFESDYAAELLWASVDKPFEKDKVLYHQHTALDLVNIFAIQNPLYDFFAKKHSLRNLSFVHVTSALIEGIFHLPISSAGKRLFVYLENKSMVIVAFEGRKLLLCNKFDFVNEDDFTYYIMLVADELQINPETDKLMLWGELTPSSALYEKIYKYFRHIDFGIRPTEFSFGYQFDEVFDHRYFALYCLLYCET